MSDESLTFAISKAQWTSVREVVDLAANHPWSSVTLGDAIVSFHSNMTDLEENTGVEDDCVHISAEVCADSLAGDTRFQTDSHSSDHG